MKHLHTIFHFLLISSLLVFAVSCKQKDDYSWVKNAIDVACQQVLAASVDNDDSGLTPCTVRTYYSQKDYDWQMGHPEADSYDDDKPFDSVFKACQSNDWRSGFFSGSLWYLYGLTGNEELKSYAVKYTNRLNQLRYVKSTHDIGFMSNCSYGNALIYAPSDTIKPFLTDCAENLIGRFNDTIRCIQSWGSSPRWNYPVIIDNMMNLELLFNVSKLTGDSKYHDIAVIHANTTIKNHFRDDNTTFHVVSYNNDGSIEKKCTAQGRSDDSAWARGQAWGFYGYTTCYKETKDVLYHDQACKIADMIMEKVTTEDGVPYWDYCAPDDPRTPRDASAGAITASAMLELSTLVENGEKYFKYGEKILKSLSSPAYLAEVGSNFNFVLMHSVTSLPSRSEVDAPLNYADYYYIEALKRYMEIKGIKYSSL